MVTSAISKRKNKPVTRDAQRKNKPVTRDTLRKEGRQWQSCGTCQVIQYHNTWWFASFVFVVYNNDTFWQLMGKNVQNYVRSYFTDPGAATSLYALYELRNEEETTDQCRRIPKHISDLYLRFIKQRSEGYISSAVGGHGGMLFDAFCVASKINLAVIVVNSKLIWPLKEEFDMHLNYPSALARVVRVECWCPLFPLFSSKLKQLCDMAINLLYGFECIGGWVIVKQFMQPDHIMGFVRCQDGLTTGYEDDFFLSQSYHFSFGSRVSQLEHARPEVFGFNSQKTRSSTDKVFQVTFIYTRIPEMTGKMSGKIEETYKSFDLMRDHLKHMNN